MSTQTINFTPEKAEALVTAIVVAEGEGRESFIFEGYEFLVTYARYLVLHLVDRGLLPEGSLPERPTPAGSAPPSG